MPIPLSHVQFAAFKTACVCHTRGGPTWEFLLLHSPLSVHVGWISRQVNCLLALPLDNYEAWTSVSTFLDLILFICKM